MPSGARLPIPRLGDEGSPGLGIMAIGSTEKDGLHGTLLLSGTYHCLERVA